MQSAVDHSGGGGDPEVTEQKLSVVIPAYKEEPNIQAVYDRLSAILDRLGMAWEIIFSVDPSPDRTEELILKLRERDPRIKMLRFSRRFGQPMATLGAVRRRGRR